MKKFRILGVIVISGAVIAFAIGINLDKFSVFTHAEQDPNCCGRTIPAPATIESTKDVKSPEYVPYMFLFQHLSAIKDKEDLVNDLRGKSGLSEEDFAKLLETTNRYKEEVSGYDASAKVIIDDFHRIYPPGQLSPGTGPGRAPQELLDLQRKRQDAALKHRDELKGLLDDNGKARFEQFVDSEIKSKISVPRKEGR